MQRMMWCWIGDALRASSYVSASRQPSFAFSPVFGSLPAAFPQTQADDVGLRSKFKELLLAS